MSDASIGDFEDDSVVEELTHSPSAPAEGIKLIEKRMRYTRYRLNLETESNSQSICILRSMVHPVARSVALNENAILDMQSRNETMRGEIEGLRKDLNSFRQEVEAKKDRDSQSVKRKPVSSPGAKRNSRKHLKKKYKKMVLSEAEDDWDAQSDDLKIGMFDDSDRTDECERFNKDGQERPDEKDDDDEYEEDSFLVNDLTGSDPGSISSQEESFPSVVRTHSRSRRDAKKKTKGRRGLLDDSDSEFVGFDRKPKARRRLVAINKANRRRVVLEDSDSE